MEYYEQNVLLNISEPEQIRTFLQIESWTGKIKYYIPYAQGVYWKWINV